VVEKIRKELKVGKIIKKGKFSQGIDMACIDFCRDK